MNWLKMSLAKARNYDADTDTGGSPAATLVSDGADAGSDGGATDQDAGGKGGEELQAPDWMTSVPKEHRDDKALWKHKDFSSYLKESRENSDKLASFDPEKALNIPGDDTSEEDREAFYQKLGKPETADGYELDDPGFPDGLNRDTDLEGQIKAFAHQVNMPTDMLNKFVGLYNGLMAEVYTAAKEADAKELEENTNALKAELKDGYNEFVLKGQRTAIKLGGEELITLFKDCGIAAHPTIVKAFGNFGNMISEDSALGGGGGQGGKPTVPLGIDGKPRMTYDSDKKQE